MIEFRRKFICGAGILLGMLWVTETLAVGYVPLSLDGSISYSYGFASANNNETESTSIVFSIGMSAYIWQPWFITNSWGLSFGTTRGTSGNSGGNSSQYVTGRFNFDVFPQSRVPFSLSFSQGNSSFENDSVAKQFTTNEFTTSRLLLRQSYIGKQGVYGNMIWSHSESDSGARGTSSSDIVNLNMRKRVPMHSLTGDIGYSTNESSQSASKPERVYLNVNHSYVPGTSVTQNSSLNLNSNTLTGDNRASDSVSLQVGSFFSWRPKYRSLSVSGGARLASADSSTSTGGDTSSRSFGLNLGLAYQLSTRVRVNGNAAANISDESGQQNTTTTQNGSLSFSSEQYSLLGYNYSYGLSASLGNSTNESAEGQSTDSQAATVGLNHRAARNWNVGRASNLSFSVSQGGGVSTNFVSGDEPNRSLTHSVNVGVSTRGRSGTSFVAWSFSDNRNFSEIESEFQLLSMSMSRSHTINRTSAINATGTLQTSRQAGDDLPAKTVSNARVTASYRTGRFLGIFAMPYSSNVTYARPMNDGKVGEETIDWENKVDYNIGLLSTGLVFNARKSGGLDPTFSMFFRATRSF